MRLFALALSALLVLPAACSQAHTSQTKTTPVGNPAGAPSGIGLQTSWADDWQIKDVTLTEGIPPTPPSALLFYEPAMGDTITIDASGMVQIESPLMPPPKPPTPTTKRIPLDRTTLEAMFGMPLDWYTNALSPTMVTWGFGLLAKPGVGASLQVGLVGGAVHTDTMLAEYAAMLAQPGKPAQTVRWTILAERVIVYPEHGAGDDPGHGGRGPSQPYSSSPSSQTAACSSRSETACSQPATISRRMRSSRARNCSPGG